MVSNDEIRICPSSILSIALKTSEIGNERRVLSYTKIVLVFSRDSALVHHALLYGAYDTTLEPYSQLRGDPFVYRVLEAINVFYPIDAFR